MLTTKERRPAIWTLGGCTISALQDPGAIRECEEHGWKRDRADPHARDRALISRDKIRRPACLPIKRRLRFETCWTRSATLARNVFRKTTESRAAFRIRPCSQVRACS